MNSAVRSTNDQSGITLASIERQAIVNALEASAGNKTVAARMLGLPRRTFYEKLTRYKIN